MPPIVLSAGIHNLRIGESIRIPADYRVKLLIEFINGVRGDGFGKWK